jgi:hypothetical protein
MCSKCKLQLGQHLIDNQVQNDNATSNISSSGSIHQQCHEFNLKNSSSKKDAQNFDTISTAELIKLQNQLHQINNLIDMKNESNAQ